MLDIKDIFHIWTLFTQDVLGNSQRCVPINIHIMCLLGLICTLYGHGCLYLAQATWQPLCCCEVT